MGSFPYGVSYVATHLGEGRVPVPLGPCKPRVGDSQFQPGAAASHRDVEVVRDMWRSHMGSVMTFSEIETWLRGRRRSDSPEVK